MKMGDYSGFIKIMFLRLIALSAIAYLAILPANANETFVSQDILPYGFSISSLQGNNEVDPNKTITLEALGIGTRLSTVKLFNNNGVVLFEAQDQTRLVLPKPLAFESQYTLLVTAARSWTGDSKSYKVKFITVTVPKLEGPILTMVGPDSSVKLHFDRPVGKVQVKGDLSLKATHDDTTGQNIRLLASNYEQDKTYKIKINYKTTKGISLPPINLELTTAPPLSAQTNVKGISNLGLMLPLQVTFNEPLYDRSNVASSLKVQTRDGHVIDGKWRWISPRQLRFTPQPSWPATSMIEVSDVRHQLRSERGGKLEHVLIEQFSTGTDRRLFVYLDRQRVDAVENGKIVRSFKVSTGKSKTPTVMGTFYIYDRYRRKRMRSDVGRGQPGFYEVENVPYTQFFHKDYAFHGAFWHNKFGRPASHGCINLATKDQNKQWPNVSEDAGWLYNWGALGLPVTVMDKEPPVGHTDSFLADVSKIENKGVRVGTADMPVKPIASERLAVR